MIRRIKWENIFLLLIIPVAIIQFFKAAEGFKIASIIMSTTLYGGFYYIIRTIRKEGL
jgi:hypothetical protein